MTRHKMYIEKALRIFKEEGLRMSIDELTSKMGTSKKTIYNHFTSKEILLSECIQETFSKLDHYMQMLYLDDKNAIECMYQSFGQLETFFEDHSPIFINDLNKLYPEMISSKHTSGFGGFREKLAHNLDKGIKEGLYSKDLDVHFISSYLVHSIFGYFFHSVISNNSFSASGYFERIISYHLKALVTIKGRELLK